MAAVPDPLTVVLVQGGPPLLGTLQGITHRVTTFWVAVVVVGRVTPSDRLEDQSSLLVTTLLKGNEKIVCAYAPV